MVAQSQQTHPANADNPATLQSKWLNRDEPHPKLLFTLHNLTWIKRSPVCRTLRFNNFIDSIAIFWAIKILQLPLRHDVGLRVSKLSKYRGQQQRQYSGE